MTEFLSDPKGIESLSFRIIDEELGQKGRGLPDEARDVVYRVIHATADMDYADILEFKNGAIAAALGALGGGAGIYTDTAMIQHGINSASLELCGCFVRNFVHDEDVISESKRSGVTRSMLAVEKAAKDPNIGVYAIGNAPTALLTLVDLVERGEANPKLIVGVPVGFVNAAESKDRLSRLDGLGVPYIRTVGRKGGSTVAAAIINSLLYKVARRW